MLRTEVDWLDAMRAAWPNLPADWRPRVAADASPAPDCVDVPSQCSIVLIARNEERTLPRLLHQLRTFTRAGGDVVVVDTGSTDRTRELASMMGARVFRPGSDSGPDIDRPFDESVRVKTIREALSRWDPDGEATRLVLEQPRFFHFARARNYAHDQARHHWTWSLDASDLILALDRHALLRSLGLGLGVASTQTPILAEPLYVQRYCSRGSPALLRVERWFDRRLRHYAGRVHEVPVYRPGTREPARRVPVPPDVLSIEHHQNPESKRGHYLTGLALDAVDRTLDARALFYFGRELCGRPSARRAGRNVLLAHLRLRPVGPEFGRAGGDLERAQTCQRLAELALDNVPSPGFASSVSASKPRTRERERERERERIVETQRARDEAAQRLVQSWLEYPLQRAAMTQLAQLALDRGQAVLADMALAAAARVMRGQSNSSEPEWLFGPEFDRLRARAAAAAERQIQLETELDTDPDPELEPELGQATLVEVDADTDAGRTK
jgi:hypothetical protein